MNSMQGTALSLSLHLVQKKRQLAMASRCPTSLKSYNILKPNTENQEIINRL
jgi:hypothetical protein